MTISPRKVRHVSARRDVCLRLTANYLHIGIFDHNLKKVLIFCHLLLLPSAPITPSCSYWLQLLLLRPELGHCLTLCSNSWQPAASNYCHIKLASFSSRAALHCTALLYTSAVQLFWRVILYCGVVLYSCTAELYCIVELYCAAVLYNCTAVTYIFVVYLHCTTVR